MVRGSQLNDLLPENGSGELRLLARTINNLLVDQRNKNEALILANKELATSQMKAERTSILYKMLSEIGTANVQAKIREQLFKLTCQIIQESGLFKMVWIGLLDKATGDVTPVASAGYVSGYLDILKINIHSTETGSGPSATAVKTKKPVVCNDIESNPHMRYWREQALRRDYRASATFPIIQSGEAVGVLVLYWSKKGTLDEELINALQNMMDSISFSLDFIEESKQRENAQKELHELTKHLQNALENERSHIARELHDELGQSMTALRYDLNWLLENMDEQDSDVNYKLKSMKSMVIQTVDSIRRISEDLRPGMLDNLGLAAAVENHVAKFMEQSGIQCELSINEIDFELDDQVATALFRIVQESLTNVARHSGANHVVIRLHQLEDKMLLIIQDNGRGLPSVQDERKKTFGLLGMRERVKMLGGTLDIFNESGSGVRIEACVSMRVTGGQ